MLKQITFLLFLLLGGQAVRAQVSFRNPTYAAGTGPASSFTVNSKVVDNPSDPVTVPTNGSISPFFEMTLYRAAGSSTQGYVEIYAGTGPGALRQPALTTPGNRPIIDNSLWVAAQDINGNPVSGYQQLYLNGSFDVNGANLGNSTGFYAVYYSTQGGAAAMGEVSHPVLLSTYTPVVVDPITAWIPCSGGEICDDQCVKYGAVPRTIKGRVLAEDRSQEFQEYLGYVSSHNMAAFAQGSEEEVTNWERSYNQSDWTVVSNGGRDFSPPACTQTTYYRRRSHHHERHWYGDNRYAFWYYSNTVTITPGPATPAPVKATYTTCGSGPVAIAITAATYATSYNWTAPAGWSLNGQGTTITNTTSLNMQVTPPANVANGTYQVFVTANGGCVASDKGTISIVVNSGTPPAAPTNVTWVRTSGGICAPVYGLRMPPVAGATSYYATDGGGYNVPGVVTSTGTVTFDMGYSGPAYGVTATVFAASSCGTASTALPPTDLAGPNSKCGQRAAEAAAYPNPADQQVTVSGQLVRVSIYDATGHLRSSGQATEASETVTVPLTDLPSGLYHVKTELKDGKVLHRQLVVKHE